MTICDFYQLSSKFSSPLFVPNFGKNIHGLSGKWKLINGKYSGFDFPIIFKQDIGKIVLRDLLDTGFASLYLISGKMKKTLEENKITGWKSFDIKVFDKHNIEINDYFGLSIVGTCGSIDYNKSEIIEKRLVPNAPLGKYYKGLNIGLDKWDGSDFFCPENNRRIIVTAKVYKILKENRFSNIWFENLSEIETLIDSIGVH